MCSSWRATSLPGTKLLQNTTNLNATRVQITIQKHMGDENWKPINCYGHLQKSRVILDNVELSVKSTQKMVMSEENTFSIVSLCIKTQRSLHWVYFHMLVKFEYQSWVFKKVAADISSSPSVSDPYSSSPSVSSPQLWYAYA